MSIGKNIKIFRIKAGMQQKELGEKLGKRVQYLSAIENDKREPSLTLLKQIAGALKVPVSMLLWDEVEDIKDDTPVGRLQMLLLELVSAKGKDAQARQS